MLFKYNWNNIYIKGKDAHIVYSIKYIVACKRSGWLPHFKISIMVGNKESSNVT